MAPSLPTEYKIRELSPPNAVRSTPVICFPALPAQSKTLAGLAGFLDGWPIFGIELWRELLLVPEVPELQAIARSALSTVRKIQPNGPYCLAGHSLGGTIAHAVAHELEQTDEEVAFVWMLDSPSQKGRVSNEVECMSNVRDAKIYTDWCSRFPEQTNPIVAKLEGRSPEERRQLALQWGRESGLLPDDIDDETVMTSLLFAHKWDPMLVNHRAVEIAADIYIAWAKDDIGWTRQDPRFGESNWADLTRGRFDEIEVQGNHFTCLFPPGIAEAAKNLRAHLLERFPVSKAQSS